MSDLDAAVRVLVGAMNLNPEDTEHVHYARSVAADVLKAGGVCVMSRITQQELEGLRSWAEEQAEAEHHAADMHEHAGAAIGSSATPAAIALMRRDAERFHMIAELARAALEAAAEARHDGGEEREWEVLGDWDSAAREAIEHASGGVWFGQIQERLAADGYALARRADPDWRLKAERWRCPAHGVITGVDVIPDTEDVQVSATERHSVRVDVPRCAKVDDGTQCQEPVQWIDEPAASPSDDEIEAFNAALVDPAADPDAAPMSAEAAVRYRAATSTPPDPLEVATMSSNDVLARNVIRELQGAGYGWLTGKRAARPLALGSAGALDVIASALGSAMASAAPPAGHGEARGDGGYDWIECEKCGYDGCHCPACGGKRSLQIVRRTFDDAEEVGS